MKIFQITHFGSLTNYGALLQAYALSRALRDLGHDVTLLRASFSFNNILRKWYKSPLRVIKAWKKLKDEQKQEKLHPRRFAEFASTYINLSQDEYHSHKELLKAGLQADALVTGSDQVWSSKVPFPPYFLEFGSESARRFSYAASTGSRARFDAAYLSALKEKTGRFYAVSVREHEALEQCRKAGIDSAELVPDPVMLFPADHWRNLYGPKSEKLKRYCFVYAVGRKTLDNDFLLQYCSRNDLEIIFVPSQNNMKNKIPGAKLCYPTIPEFLKLIDGADMMITDSFHGTSFALLFNTPVFVAAAHRNDARFMTLDRYFGIGKCYFYDPDKLKEAFQFCHDWTGINLRMDGLRQTGWSFLRRAAGE